MRILKSGVIPEYDFKCHVCGCEFIALRTECDIEGVIEFPSTKIIKVAFVLCPDCHTKLEHHIKEEQKDD